MFLEYWNVRPCRNRTRLVASFCFRRSSTSSMLKSADQREEPVSTVPEVHLTRGYSLRVGGAPRLLAFRQYFTLKLGQRGSMQPTILINDTKTTEQTNVAGRCVWDRCLSVAAVVGGDGGSSPTGR